MRERQTPHTASGEAWLLNFDFIVLANRKHRKGEGFTTFSLI